MYNNRVDFLLWCQACKLQQQQYTATMFSCLKCPKFDVRFEAFFLEHKRGRQVECEAAVRAREEGEGPPNSP